MSFSDSAMTLMNNTQSLAATGNVQLRSAISQLEEMIDDVYRIPSTSIDATIPEVDIGQLPDVIAEVQGYLDGVLADSETIAGAVSNNASTAIAKMNEILAPLYPADTPITLTDRQVSFAQEVTDATRVAAETERKAQEVKVLKASANRGFALPPGQAVAAIASLRLKTSALVAEAAAEQIAKQQQQNAQLFTNRIEQLFQLQSEVVRAWNNASLQTLRTIGQVLEDYERSPLTDARRQAMTASTLAGAYSDLNRAATQLAAAVGTSYKAELAPYQLDVIEAKLQMGAYEAGQKLTLAMRGRVASALASALGNAGRVAGSCLGAVSAHGSYVERSFS